MADHPILDAAPPADAARLRGVEAAMLGLRRGQQACVAGEPAMAALAIETAGPADLAALVARAASPPILVLASSRAAALSAAIVDNGGPVAFQLPAAGWDLESLRAIADPAGQPAFDLPQAVLPDAAPAALALAKLARLLPALVMAPATPGTPTLAQADIAAHATLAATQLERVSEAVVPIEGVADCRLVAFRSPGSALDHLAILIGRPEAVAAPLVRVHSECFTGDLLGSLRCDCGPQLRGAVDRIAAEGAGAVLYLAQEGRGIGLPNKLRAYALQDRGLDTLDANRALGFSADERDFQIAAAMLRQLGLRTVRLLTNNPSKLATLAAHGIDVAGRESLLFAGNGVNDGYLDTKHRRFGHWQS